MSDYYYRCPPRSRDEIDAKARKVRATFGVSDVKVLPILRILEYGLPNLFPDFNFRIVPVEEMPGREAVTYPAANEIAVREDTYELAYLGDPRARFTLAHEAGHFFLHPAGTITLARESENAPPPMKYESPEWQADAFAAEFLSPLRLLKGLSVEEIAAQCKISTSAAKIQFERLARQNWFGPLRPQQLMLPGFERL